MAFYNLTPFKTLSFLTLCPSILPALYSTLAILAFPYSTNIQGPFCCISPISAAILLFNIHPPSRWLEMKAFLLLMAVWVLLMGAALLQPGVRWRCAPPVSHPADRGHQSMCLRWQMAGRLVTKPNHMRTHKTLGQVWLYDIHLHTTAPYPKHHAHPSLRLVRGGTARGGAGWEGDG